MSNKTEADRPEKAGRVGIIGAMDVEVALLKSALKDPSTLTVANMDFVSGKLGSTDVVVVKCGVGKVDAGICVQVLVDRLGVTRVINTGVAGSLDASLDVGDLVVSRDLCYHDVDATIFGYKPGEVPGLKRRFFEADQTLVEAALAAAHEVAPEVNAVEGRVVSGDQFISTDDDKRRLAAQFGGMCCEMEGAAVAQAAWLNNVPFVVVRAISDKVGSTTPVEYAVFEEKAAHHCAAIVQRMVESL
ncbi:MAG: 5'-methylthioadenosine/adenosylhomocysteine nucleosidase [Tractidigestivibacter sp.]|jgi:adenosylhomocysteine nucleosidase|uniref:5'-methylthioadenosine/adenosylhomocysteine nucleosidase n=1 Tax=Tractidigestivibacter sp. TaxID=2847320 RepID=UPI003D948B2C